MDEDGNVCVVGKKGTHIFMVQDGLLTMDVVKLNYKAGLEKQTIAACLLKFLASDAPINAYRTETHNKWLSRVKMILAAIAMASGVVWVICVLDIQMGKNYIDMIIRKTSPEMYPDTTYEKAFDAFFDNARWKYFQSDKGQDVVEFQGDCEYYDDTVTVLIQFLLNKDEKTYNIYTMAIDNQEQSLLMYSIMMEEVFESYDGNGEKGALSSDGLEENLSLPAPEESETEENTVPEDEESDYRENAVDGIDVLDDRVAGLNGTVNSGSIFGISGQWGKGETVFDLSLYSDTDEYNSYDEIGSFFCGDSEGSLYFLGSDDTGWYLMGQLAGDDVVLLKYEDSDEMEILDASGSLSSEVGTILCCFRHYES